MSDERKEMESRKAENVREARCLSIDGHDVQGHPKKPRFSNKYYHRGEERFRNNQSEIYIFFESYFLSPHPSQRM